MELGADKTPERKRGMFDGLNLKTGPRTAERGAFAEMSLPAQERVPFEFRGRIWQKPLDHVLYLDTVYGDWRVPRPAHDYARDDRSVVSAQPWAGTWVW